MERQQLQKESSMKIALVGATGNVGTRLISELTRRGHHVTAIARHPEKLQGQASVSPVLGDVQNENALAAVLAGHDVVMHSVEFLNVLRGEKELDWTFLSPSYVFAPGERTGKFRLGKDELLVAADGQSRISTEDFAIALVDELEQPKHSRQRFTVGY